MTKINFLGVRRFFVYHAVNLELKQKVKADFPTGTEPAYVACQCASDGAKRGRFMVAYQEAKSAKN